MKVLSTKVLPKELKVKLEANGICVNEYDAVHIEFIDFQMPRNIRNAIFTSQNGVRAFLSNLEWCRWKNGLRCFCVGEKTNTLLSENGLNVVKMAENASELAIYLSKTSKNDSFHFFSGNLKRPDIMQLVKSHKMTIIDQIVYKTHQNHQKIDENYQKVLFFSPSGVQSFTELNSLANSEAYCIGSTTASEAKQHTNAIQISNSTTIESLIDCVLV